MGSSEIQRLAGDPPSPWEEPYAFSRLVRVGDFILVGGTTAVDPSGAVVGETPYEQTVEILRKIEHELDRVGAAFANVVQIRAYVTDISRSDDVGRAHGEAFAGIRPLMTMVEVSGLIDPRLLVELEAVAVLP